MKRINEVLTTLLLAALAPVAFAQHGGHGGGPSVAGSGNTRNDSAMRDFERAVLLQATDDQRALFAQCMDATERARNVANQMVEAVPDWRYDAGVFPPQKQQLQQALVDVGTAHQHFRHTLDRFQEKQLEKHLRKLDRLETELSSRMVLVDRELSANRVDYKRLYGDTRRIQDVTAKWRSEHHKIAKGNGNRWIANSNAPRSPTRRRHHSFGSEWDISGLYERRNG